MIDRETETARWLVRHLDRGVADLRSGTIFRLQQVRAVALAGAGARFATGAELLTAGVGNSGAQRPGRSGHGARWLGLAFLVMACGFGLQQWQAAQQVREFEELDAQLLASDLPIDAYLDRGFQNWLKTAFEH